MPTIRSYRQRLAELTGLGRILSAFGSATATTVVSSDLIDTGVSDNAWDRWYIYRPAAATAADYVRRVLRGTAGYTSSSGTLTHAGGNYADTTVTAERLELWRPDTPPLDVDRAIQRVLQLARRQVIAPLSLLPDADAENVGTNAVSTSNATVSKAVVLGEYRGGAVWQVLPSANAGYAAWTSISVNPGDQVYLGAWIRADSGGSDLILIDRTNGSATIGTLSVDQSDYGENMVRREATYTIPSGCFEVDVRMAGDNGATCWFDDVDLHVIGTRRMPAPLWLMEREWITELLQLAAPGDGRPIGELGFRPVRWSWTEWDGSNIGPGATQVTGGYRAWLHLPAMGASTYYVRAARPYAYLLDSFDDNTTSYGARLEWIVAGAAADIYRVLSTNAEPTENRTYYNQKGQEWRREWLRWCLLEQPGGAHPEHLRHQFGPSLALR